MNEAETRAEHIDPALKAAGWGVVEGSRIRREFPITKGRFEGGGRRGKALTADYMLEYRNTKLAVVEAKAWNEELTEGGGRCIAENVNADLIELVRDCTHQIESDGHLSRIRQRPHDIAFVEVDGLAEVVPVPPPTRHGTYRPRRPVDASRRRPG